MKISVKQEVRVVVSSFIPQSNLHSGYIKMQWNVFFSDVYIYYFLKSYQVVRMWILRKQFVPNYLLNRTVVLLLAVDNLTVTQGWREWSHLGIPNFSVLNPFRRRSLCDVFFLSYLNFVFWIFTTTIFKVKALLSFTLGMTRDIWYVTPFACTHNAAFSFMFCIYNCFPVFYLIYII